jgi:hypothetical protein
MSPAGFSIIYVCLTEKINALFAFRVKLDRVEAGIQNVSYNRVGKSLLIHLFAPSAPVGIGIYEDRPERLSAELFGFLNCIPFYCFILGI